MKQPGALMVALVAIAVLVAGCGGGGSSSTTASISKAEFVKKGNAICKAGSEKMESDFQAYAKENGLTGGKEPTAAEGKKLAETILLPEVKQEVAELKALGLPEGAEAVIESAEESIADGEADPAKLISSEATFKKTNELAHEYGLTACGEEE